MPDARMIILLLYTDNFDCPTSNGFFADNSDCRQFFHCVKGVARTLQVGWCQASFLNGKVPMTRLVNLVIFENATFIYIKYIHCVIIGYLNW